MEIIVSCRNSEIKAGIKKHAEDRAAQVGDMYNKLTSLRVILNVEKGEEKAEFILHGKNIDFEADSSGDNLYLAIDRAADKIEKQLRKYLDKIQDHHKA